MRNEIPNRVIEYFDKREREDEQKRLEAENEAEQKRLEERLQAEEVDTIVRATGKSTQEVKDALAIVMEAEARNEFRRENLRENFYMLAFAYPLAAMLLVILPTLAAEKEVPGYVWPMILGPTVISFSAAKAIKPKQ